MISSDDDKNQELLDRLRQNFYVAKCPIGTEPKAVIEIKRIEVGDVISTEAKDLVLVGYYKTEQLDVIKDTRMYYVPVADGKGSINMVSGFERTKYLLLHHDKERLLVRLKGEGPKFYPKVALEALGFSPSGDFYLVFEIKNFNPVEGIDPYAYELERKGLFKYTPYFTTIDKFVRATP